MSCLFSSVSKENFSAGDMSCNSLSIVSPPSLFAVSCKHIIEHTFVAHKGESSTISSTYFLHGKCSLSTVYGTGNDVS